MKKIEIGTRPSARPAPAAADQWVENRSGSERMKRLTIDIPESLHRAIKMHCAMHGTKMADEVRELLMQKYEPS